MAKFERGLQHAAFENAFCFNCLNYRSVKNKKPLVKVTEKDNETGFGCTLMDMHILYQNELEQKYLDSLISADFVCPMRLTVSDAKTSLTEYQKRLELENNQLRQGLTQGKLL